MNYYDILRKEPLFWSRIGLGANPDVRNEKNEITFIDENWKDFLNEHKFFADIGCKLHTTVIHSGWVGENEYDYSATDKTLEAIFSISDDILYLPRVELNPPLEWLKANPEEIALSSYADRDPGKIAEVYKTFGTAGDIAKVRGGSVNKHGVYLQSFFSDKWLKDAKEALKRFIRHLEDGKYGKRIVGYQLAYGMCGELCNWGAWKDYQHWGDFSLNAQKAFFRFCIDKYGSFDAAKKEYGISDLSPDNIVPHPSERYAQNRSVSDYFRVNNKRAIDFSLLLSERNTENLCILAETGKKETDKLFGAFYGYLLTKYPTETGHIGIQKLMECESIDFLSAPNIYYRCGAGEPGGSQATSMSVAREKIWLDELDNDTHIAKKYQQQENHPENFFETKTILWREVARNLSWNDQNFWWMDLYGGWFLDEQIMGELARIARFNREMRKQPCKSISEILFVTDEVSLAYQTADDSFAGCRKVGVMNEIGAELKLCGAPVDEYRLEDLRSINLSQYKMIVFANAFVLDDDMRNIISSVPETTVLVWNYAAGIRKGEQFSFSFTKELTGMEIAEYGSDCKKSNGYGAEVMCLPLKICEGDGVVALERYEDGEIKTAKCKNHILAVSPGFYAEDFHRLAKEVGCHMYTSSGCTVFADHRFIGVFPGKKGAHSLNFKEKKNYIDVISGAVSETIDQLKEKGAYIFVPQES